MTREEFAERLRTRLERVGSGEIRLSSAIFDTPLTDLLDSLEMVELAMLVEELRGTPIAGSEVEQAVTLESAYALATGKA